MVDDPFTSVLSAQINLRLDLGQGRLREALTVAATAADRFDSEFPVEIFQMLNESATAAVYQADLATAHSYIERGIPLSLSDPSLSVYSAIGKAGVLAVEGDFLQARELMSPVVALASQLSAGNPEIARALLAADPSRLQSMGWLSWMLFQLDALNIAADLSTAALEWAREAGVLTVLPYALTVRASIALRAAEGRVAEASASQSLSLAREMGLKLEIVNALSLSALVACHFGNEQESRALVEEGLAAAADIGMDFNVGLLRLAAGISELGLRKVPSAIAELEECRRICRAGRSAGLRLLALAARTHRMLRTRRRWSKRPGRSWNCSISRPSKPVGQFSKLGRPGVAVCLEPDYDSAAFEEALDWHAQVRAPVRARREPSFAYGQRLRRDRKRAAGRVQAGAGLRGLPVNGSRDVGGSRTYRARSRRS